MPLIIGRIEAVAQILACIARPGGNIDKGYYITLYSTLIVKTRHCLDKHIDTLIAHLHTAAYTYDECIVGNLVAGESRCHTKTGCTGCCSGSAGSEYGFSTRSEGVPKSSLKACLAFSLAVPDMVKRPP